LKWSYFDAARLLEIAYQPVALFNPDPDPVVMAPKSVLWIGPNAAQQAEMI